MTDRHSSAFSSLFGAAQLSALGFFVSGVRNVWLAVEIGAEGLGANSLSSLLISLFVFSDFGAVLYLRKGSGVNKAPPEMPNLSLVLKKISLLSSIGISLVSLLAGIIYLFIENFAFAAAFVAAAVVYPVQSSFNFRSTIYSAKGDQIRGSVGSLLASLINFAVSIITVDLIGIWVIVLGPASGFFVTLVSEYLMKSRLRMPIHGILKARVRSIRPEVRRESLKLALSQFLALVLSSSDLVYTICFLGLSVAGELSFVNNLVVLLTIFPVTLSNSMNSRISLSSAESKQQTFAKLRSSRSLLLNITAILTIVGTLTFQVVVSKILVDYENTVGWVWILTIAAFLYNSTFYTSTITIAMNAQNIVMKAQVVALVFQFLIVIFLIQFKSLSIFTIAISSLLKMAMYLVVHTVEINRISARELPSLGKTILTLLPNLALLFTCLYFQESRNFSALYTLASFGVLAYLLRTPREWSMFKKDF